MTKPTMQPALSLAFSKRPPALRIIQSFFLRFPNRNLNKYQCKLNYLKSTAKKINALARKKEGSKRVKGAKIENLII